ncbi:hypothetical protein ACPSM1_23030 [Micromonospora chersina]
MSVTSLLVAITTVRSDVALGAAFCLIPLLSRPVREARQLSRA